MKLELCVLAAAAGSAMGQTPVPVWSRQIGTPADDTVVAAAPDGSGGVLIAGYTDGDLGGVNAGSADPFLTRYDGSGNQLWIRQFGTASFDQTRDVAAAGGGSSFVLGTTSGSLGGPALGGVDSFVALYDGAGAQVLIRQFGTSGSDFAKGIACNGLSAIIVGNTTGVIGGGGGGGNDPFIGKFDGAANVFVWVRQFGSPGTENASGVALDGAGGAFIGGFTDGNVGGPSAGSYDAFIARYDNAGNQMWVDQFGSAGTETAGEIAPDGAGGVVFIGQTTGNLVGLNAGGSDIFLARYDAAGNQLWLRQFGTSGDDSGAELRTAGLGKMWFAGSTSGTLWGPSAGSNDALVAKFDAAGNTLLWGYQFGTSGIDTGAGLAGGVLGPIYVAGSTTGALGGPNAGLGDVYVTRFAPACYADCTLDGSLSVADFGCFQTKFVLGDPYADCNTVGGLTVADFGCFQTAFVAGCP